MTTERILELCDKAAAVENIERYKSETGELSGLDTEMIRDGFLHLKAAILNGEDVSPALLALGWA